MVSHTPRQKNEGGKGELPPSPLSSLIPSEGRGGCLPNSRGKTPPPRPVSGWGGGRGVFYASPPPTLAKKRGGLPPPSPSPSSYHLEHLPIPGAGLVRAGVCVGGGLVHHEGRAVREHLAADLRGGVVRGEEGGFIWDPTGRAGQGGI